MPSLLLCGVYLPFAGDDLRFLCVCSILFRLLQLALAVSVIVYTATQAEHVDDELQGTVLECEWDEQLSPLVSHGIAFMYAHCGLSTVVAFLGISTAVPMYMISSRGSPTDAKPRENLVPLCMFNMTALNAFRIVAFVMGLLASHLLDEYCICVADTIHLDLHLPLDACPDQDAWYGVVVALNVTNVLDIIYTSCQLLYFGCQGNPCTGIVPSEFRWKACFHCCIGCSSVLTCCLFGGMEAMAGDFGDLAILMSDYTSNEESLNVTASDVAVGLVMLIRKRRERFLETREMVQQESNQNVLEELENGSFFSRSASRIDVFQGGERPNGHLRRSSSLSELEKAINRSKQNISVKPEDSKPANTTLSRQNPRERRLIAEGARYMPLAQATYSWIQYLFEHQVSGIPRLLLLIMYRCTCFCHHSEDRIVGDWAWGIHQIAMEELAGIPREDIVFASFKQSVEAVPYLVALDHEWKSIVIAIRGTLSMESIVADLTLRPIELSALGEEHGFDGTAKYCHNGVLKSSLWIYNDIVRRKVLQGLLEGEYHSYSIRVVGHSLGAGCAAMVSLLLRPKYPGLSCLAFSSPGSVFSENLADECSAWVTSFVVDNDIVPRLNVQSLEDLRDNVLRMIVRIQIPKYEVWKIHARRTQDRSTLTEENNDILCSEDEIMDSPFKQRVERFLEYQTRLRARDDSPAMIPLYPPGRLIQLVLVSDGKISSNREASFEQPDTETKQYVPRWVHRSDIQEIVISSHLFLDHEPSSVKRTLQSTAKEHFRLQPPSYKLVLPLRRNSVQL
eukprot:Nitzschia sp. Nitz4//scaffold54_size114964//70057//72567//NITZ4_003857-RA/size114964-augustus-gene-0.20-mRNA-1//-1//CDS//3329554369//8050//frame0